jgi:heme/copper-type cytochrome/quinol oxidase subunit 2
MKNIIDTEARMNERGAVKIQVVLTFILIAIIAFVVVKVAPVYIEQQGIENQLEELARLTAVRNSKPEEVKKSIDRIRSEYNLPEGSITVVALAENKAQLNIKYKREIDFVVIQWDWAVDYTADGKAL